MTAINPYSSIQQVQRPDYAGALTNNAARNTPRETGFTTPRDNPRAYEPTDLRGRLDDLIVGEVTSGRLMIGQAEDIRSAFNETFSEVAPGALQRQDALTDGEDAMDSPFSIDRMRNSRIDVSSFASGQSDIQTTASVMQKFLDALQASVDSSAAVTYGASGQNSVAAIKTVQPLLVDYRT